MGCERLLAQACMRAAAGATTFSSQKPYACAQVQRAGCERLLAQACMRAAAGLARAGRLPAHPAPFNGPEQRFEQRFGALAALSRPEPLTFAQFERSVDVSGARLPVPALATSGVSLHAWVISASEERVLSSEQYESKHLTWISLFLTTSPSVRSAILAPA